MAGSAFLFVGILVLAFLHSDAVGNLTSTSRRSPSGRQGPRHGHRQVALPRLLRRVRGEGAAVPAAHVAPDAHTEAPTAGSVILAAVLLKMGVYGFLRFSLAAVPAGRVDLAPLLLVLAVIGIIYGASSPRCRPT
jgi:NADH-quinone oxidoreductase subunit M